MLGKLVRMVKVSRPVFWLIAPAAFLFGAVSSGSVISTLVIFQAFLLTFPLGIYVFGINDLYDVKSDRSNPRRKGEVWGARIDEGDRQWIVQSSILVVCSLLLSAILSMNWLQLAVMAFFLPFPYLYSAPPARLKSRPILDSLTNATYTYGPYAMGFALSGSLGFINVPIMLFSLVFSAAHAIGTIMDMPGDRKAGINTFACAFGPRSAALFAMLILALNMPFIWLLSKSMAAVIGAYLLSSAYVAARPSPSAAKAAFIAMNLALSIWLAYAFCGYALGLFEVA